MADISKINGVPIANIEKLDAVLAANIAKVNGLVFSTAAAFLLDTYTGAAAGYSTRRLATSATVLMRVRRETAGGTGDDDEADVAYDSNNELSLDSAISNASAGVTATTLGQLLNVGTVNGTTYTNPDSLTVTASCFVDEWKDQSGNANHAEQTVPGDQPQIHSGTVNTDLITENGKAALQGGSGVYLTQPSAVSVPNDLTILAVADTSNLTTTQLILAIATATCVTGTQIFTDSNGSRINGRSSTCGFVHSTKSGNSSLFIGVLDYTNDSLTARYDGVAQSAVSGLTETPNSIDWNVGANVSGTSNNLGTYQEVVIWLTAQSPTNATNIESNVMTYFSIT